MGKVDPRQATYQNKQFAVHMTLSTAGLLRLWCTDHYEPNYGFGPSGWSSFNATGEACALCQSISGNRNGLLLETNISKRRLFCQKLPELTPGEFSIFLPEKK